MVTERAAELIRKAYWGEVFGAEFFRQLGTAEADPERRLLAAELLEDQTREAAAVVAGDLGVELGDGDGEAESARQAAEIVAALEWREQMASVVQATVAYREVYRQLSEQVPDPEHPSVSALIDHELAMNAFASAEVDGDPEALSLLVAALDADHRARIES